jgi:uncharacterized membrane protein YdjX (TVP38/TMEM64 family)
MAERERVGPRSWWRLLVLAVFATAIVALYVTGAGEQTWDWFRAHRDELHDWVGRHFAAALVAYFAVCVLAIAVSFPFSWVLSVTAGALFGLVGGVAVMSFATAAGATGAMLLSRYVFREWARARVGRWMAAIDRGLEHDGPYYLFLLRLTPLVPFFAINLGFGLTRMRARTFWLVSQVGMLPGTSLYVFAGTELGRIESPRDIVSWPVLLAFLALAVVPLALRWLLRRQARRGEKG